MLTTLAYTYDPIGNRLSRISTVAPIPTTAATYDANDRLLADTYDANGNTTSASGRPFDYDFENRLTDGDLFLRTCFSAENVHELRSLLEGSNLSNPWAMLDSCAT